MKNFFLITPIFGILLLNGCSLISPSNESIASMEITKNAVNNKDSLICAALSNKTDADKCASSVQDSKNFEAAINSANEKLCQGITNAEMKSACRIAVTNPANERKIMNEEAEKISIIEEIGDITKCKELTLEGYRHECELNIELAKKSKVITPPSDQPSKPPRT